MDIVDVDFRYVMRVDKDPNHIGMLLAMRKILQWRKAKYVKSDSIDGQEGYFIWSKWQDVRTEVEG